MGTKELLFFIISSSQLLYSIHGRISHIHHEFNTTSNLSSLAGLECKNNSKIIPQNGSKEGDIVESLPGQPQVKIAQYGGFVTVDKLAERAFYYYFVEAQHSKDSLPLLLWLNGGPSCSSLAFGAFMEIGPFRVHSDGRTLYENPFSWRHGFSYSNRTSDYDTNGDKKTAEDNYVFLINWLERFPEYKHREFFISGESYAGHLIPQLAYTINHYNKKFNSTIINLKGIMIGNPVLNSMTDFKGYYDNLKNRALIPIELGDLIDKHCDFYNLTGSLECQKAQQRADELVKDLDIVDIYAPMCHSYLTKIPKMASIYDFDPCQDNYVTAYLRWSETQKALHANVPKLKYQYQTCNSIEWLDKPDSIIATIKELMACGFRVWIFSGDTDGIVPVISTIYSINAMNLSVKVPWHAWYHHGEVGGYTEEYNGDLTFVTVRGAGHQVPSYQPIRAFSLINHFLIGKPLPHEVTISRE